MQNACINKIHNNLKHILSHQLKTDLFLRNFKWIFAANIIVVNKKPFKLKKKIILQNWNNVFRVYTCT